MPSASLSFFSVARLGVLSPLKIRLSIDSLIPVSLLNSDSFPRSGPDWLISILNSGGSRPLPLQCLQAFALVLGFGAVVELAVADKVCPLSR